MTDQPDDDFPDEYVDLDELEGLDYKEHMGKGWEQYNTFGEREAMDALREIRSEYGDDARIVISAHDEHSGYMTAVYTNSDSFGESHGIGVGYFMDVYMKGDLEGTVASDANTSIVDIDFYQIDVFHGN